jgi:aerobic-type carbon monoxide dehydrogenase small subunit (CoxS/CutS family)
MSSKETLGNISVDEKAKQQSKYACPYCSAAFSSYEDIKSHILGDHKTEPLPEPEGTIRLTINGQKYRMPVESEWTLYYLLHDQLGLTGTKLMCDRGACGSCTVILNGKAVLSCMILARECNGSQVETIEGIAAANHPLIEEYVKHHCMQCGYCTPGFVVTAKACLTEILAQAKKKSARSLAAISVVAAPILSIQRRSWKQRKGSWQEKQ